VDYILLIFQFCEDGERRHWIYQVLVLLLLLLLCMMLCRHNRRHIGGDVPGSKLLHQS
jgi:hypothetical protein